MVKVTITIGSLYSLVKGRGTAPHADSRSLDGPIGRGPRFVIYSRGERGIDVLLDTAFQNPVFDVGDTGPMYLKPSKFIDDMAHYLTSRLAQLARDAAAPNAPLQPIEVSWLVDETAASAYRAKTVLTQVAELIRKEYANYQNAKAPALVAAVGAGRGTQL